MPYIDLAKLLKNSTNAVGGAFTTLKDALVGRPMTDSEAITYADAVGSSNGAENIRVHTLPDWLPAFKDSHGSLRAFVRGESPDSVFQWRGSPMSQGTFAHEVTHTKQMRNPQSTRFVDGMNDTSVYDYDTWGLKGKNWSDFNSEQQAQIIKTYTQLRRELDQPQNAWMRNWDAYKEYERLANQFHQIANGQ